MGHIHAPTALAPDQPAVKPMGMKDRLGLEFLIWLIPAVLLLPLGFGVSMVLDIHVLTGFLVSLLAWTAVLIGIGIRINDEQDFVIIERFGRFVRMKAVGIYILWLPGLVDKVRCKDTFMAKKVPLFNKPGDEIDFTDASTPVVTSAWYHIGNPADVARKAWDKVEGQVSRWVYATQNPQERLVGVLEAELRPLLQQHDIDSAQLNCESCADKAVELARDALEAIGAYPRPENPIQVEDIKVPEDVQKLRGLKLEGEAAAQKATNQSTGYADSIIAIMKQAEAAGNTIDFETAARIFQQQTMLETLKATGANITLVSPDVDGVLKTLEVGRR